MSALEMLPPLNESLTENTGFENPEAATVKVTGLPMTTVVPAKGPARSRRRSLSSPPSPKRPR